MAGVGSMISSTAMPGDRGAEDDARAVAAGLGRVEPDRLEAAPDLRHVLDADPVQLDVLPVGDVGGAAGEVDRDLADHAQLLAGQGAAVDADAEHEVLVVELVRLERRGLAAVDAGLALGVEAVPAEPAAQVARVDRGEAAVGVDVLDARPHVQRVVVLLGLLVRVERLAVAERPLALAPGLARTGGGRGARAAGVAGAGRSSDPSRGSPGRAVRSSGAGRGVVPGVSARASRPDTSSTRSGRGRPRDAWSGSRDAVGGVGAARRRELSAAVDPSRGAHPHTIRRRAPLIKSKSH